MLYFYQILMPWHEFLSETKRTPIEVLCRGLPDEFAVYLNYARSLKPDEKPDHSYLRRILRELFLREGYQYDNVFDWAVYGFQRSAQTFDSPLRISLEELSREVHGFREELSELEAKCVDRHKELYAARQTTNPAKRLDLSASEWRSFRELHQHLLGTYHDFFTTSHHPSATEDLRNIAQHDDIPDKLLKIGIYSFLDIARYELPESLEHMLTHISYAHRLLQTLLEGVSVYRGVWLEGTRQLTWYTLSNITRSRFALIFDPRYKTSIQAIDCDRYSESEIFRSTHEIEMLQQSTLMTEGDRLKLLPTEVLGEIFSQLPKKDLLNCRFLGRHFQIVIESLPLYKHIWQWQMRLCVLTWKDFKFLSGTREWEPELVRLARREIGLAGWKILLGMVDRKRISVDILQKNLELSAQNLA